MKKTKYVLLIALLINLVFVFPCLAQESTTLTVNEAIQKAFINSKKLKNDKIEMEKKDILFKDASSLIRYTPIDISFHPGDNNLFNYFYSSQFDKRKAEKQYENDQRQLIIDVKNAYFTVLKNKMGVEAAEVSLQKSQVKLLQAQSKFTVGLMTEAELTAARAQVAVDKASLADAKAKLDNAYSELNKLIGLPVGDRPVLTDKPVVEKKEIDIDEQVNMAAGNSYEMWTAEEAVRLADQMKIFQKFYDIGDYNVDQAKNTAQDARETLRNQTRALCFSIDALYHKNEQLTEQIRQAEAALKVAEAQWKVGIITRDNVLAAQSALLQAKAGQLEVATAYVVAVDTLNKLTGKLDVRS